MMKEHERREYLKTLDEEKRQREESKFEEMKKKHGDHPKVHHPVRLQSILRRWEGGFPFQLIMRRMYYVFSHDLPLLIDIEAESRSNAQSFRKPTTYTYLFSLSIYWQNYYLQSS